MSPAYEGWWPNEDGSFTLFFGYMNSNWLEEFDVPIGPDNRIEPGGPDQGQPTHFYPRRNPFLFTIRVPRDFGNKELIWTLTTHGKTEIAHASLKTDYQIDKHVISTEVGGDGGSLRDELRTNLPPELTIEGDKRRSVKVGEATVEDVDGYARLLELAVVPAIPDSRTAPGRQVGGAGDLPGARNLRAPCRCERRISLHLRERDGQRKSLTSRTRAKRQIVFPSLSRAMASRSSRPCSLPRPSAMRRMMR